MLLSLIQLLAGMGFIFLLVSWLITIDTVGIVAGLLGMFAWGLVAYGLFNIETVDSSTTYAEPSIALLAAAAAVVCFIPALVNPWEIIGDATDHDNPHERL